MTSVLLVVHLMIILVLIGTVLLQRSEGGALGIGGGGGGGGGFGGLMTGRGAASALTKLTAWLAVAFFATSIALTMVGQSGDTGSVLDRIDTTTGAPVSAPLDVLNGGAGGADQGTSGAAAPPAPAGPAVPDSQ